MKHPIAPGVHFPFLPYHVWSISFMAGLLLLSVRYSNLCSVTSKLSTFYHAYHTSLACAYSRMQISSILSLVLVLISIYNVWDDASYCYLAREKAVIRRWNPHRGRDHGNYQFIWSSRSIATPIWHPKYLWDGTHGRQRVGGDWYFPKCCYM